MQHVEREGWAWANRVAQKYREKEQKQEKRRAQGRLANPNMRRRARTSVHELVGAIRWSREGRTGKVVHAFGDVPSRVRAEVLRWRQPLKRLVRGAIWRHDRLCVFDADPRRASLYE